MSRLRFCDLGPWAYAISLRKQIFLRHVRNCFDKTRYATTRQDERLPVVVYSHSNDMIKRGPSIDEQLQINKAHNIRLACSRINGLVLMPGESFSFWRCVGKTSRKNGFAEGRVIEGGRLVAGVGGGLCNLANTLHLLAMHSPLTITELHHHSDALAPDPGGVRTPYSAGTSVNYNFLDLRFVNTTQQPVQLCTWCEGDTLHAQLRTTEEFPHTYRITEDDHHFTLEDDGYYYRVGTIYRETLDRTTGEVLARELKRKNHSRVMFDPALIPPEQIK